MKARIVCVAALNEAQRLEAATFVRAALATYYAALEPALADRLIADAFSNDGDEVADAAVALNGEWPVGLIAGYPLAEMADRQQAALYHLMSNLPREAVSNFVAAARALASEIPAIAGDGHYLARIGVAAEARGRGLADRLLMHFFDEAGGANAVLHVHRNNVRAHAFYLRHGFRIENDANAYWIMRRAAA